VLLRDPRLLASYAGGEAIVSPLRVQRVCCQIHTEMPQPMMQSTAKQPRHCASRMDLDSARIDAVRSEDVVIARGGGGTCRESDGCKSRRTAPYRRIGSARCTPSKGFLPISVLAQASARAASKKGRTPSRLRLG
jgi:hypothetical protein